MDNKLLMFFTSLIMILIALGHMLLLALPLIFDFDGLHLTLWLLLLVEIVSKNNEQN